MLFSIISGIPPASEAKIGKPEAIASFVPESPLKWMVECKYLDHYKIQILHYDLSLQNFYV